MVTSWCCSAMLLALTLNFFAYIACQTLPHLSLFLWYYKHTHTHTNTHSQCTQFWFSWRYQLPEFSKDYHVVAIDMRGYGETERPPNKSDYTIDLLTQDIAELIPALGHSKCILVAHDWGGVVAWWVKYWSFHAYHKGKFLSLSHAHSQLLVFHAFRECGVQR